MHRALSIAVFTLLLAGIASPGLSWSDDFSLFLKIKGIENYYSQDDLRSMSSSELVSQRGNKRGEGIRLSALITGVGNITLEEVENVLLVGEERTMLLEGDDLQYLDKLWLKMGRLRAGVLPANDEVWRALQPVFGAPRFKDLEQVFVFAKGELR